jgi:hypothetical protein
MRELETKGAIYLLSRRVEGDNGELFTQNITVYASSPDHATAIVRQQFARLKDRAYQSSPDFDVEAVTLDEYKLITAGITS